MARRLKCFIKLNGDDKEQSVEDLINNFLLIVANSRKGNLPPLVNPTKRSCLRLHLLPLVLYHNLSRCNFPVNRFLFSRSPLVKSLAVRHRLIFLMALLMSVNQLWSELRSVSINKSSVFIRRHSQLCYWIWFMLLSRVKSCVRPEALSVGWFY